MLKIITVFCSNTASKAFLKTQYSGRIYGQSCTPMGQSTKMGCGLRKFFRGLRACCGDGRRHGVLASGDFSGGVQPAPDKDGKQDDAHGKGIEEPVDEEKDRPGDEEDPIREGKEEPADEKARDEGGGYWDVEPV